MENKTTSSMLALTNRTMLSVTGVEKIIESSEKQIYINVMGSTLCIDGQELEVIKLDVENGIVEIKGKVNAMKYINKKENVNLIKRIFK